MTLHIATITHFLLGIMFLGAFLYTFLTAEKDFFALKMKKGKDIFDKLCRSTWLCREIIPTKLFQFQSWIYIKNLCFWYLKNQISITNNVHILSIITIMMLVHIIDLSYIIWKSKRLNETATWISFAIPTTLGLHFYCMYFVVMNSYPINAELLHHQMTADNLTDQKVDDIQKKKVDDIIKHNENWLLFHSCFGLQCILDYFIGCKSQQNDVIQQEPEDKEPEKKQPEKPPQRRQLKRQTKKRLTRSKTPSAKKQVSTTTA